MITQILEEIDVIKILEYMEKYERGGCVEAPYLYINLKYYGVKNEFVRVFIDQEDQQIKGVYLLYFDCLHFFTKEKDYPQEKILDMIDTLSPQVIMLPGSVGENLKGLLKSKFILQKSHVMYFKNVVGQYSPKVQKANESDLEKIVDLLLLDKEYDEVYTRDSLNEQLLSRFHDGFSRYFVILERGQVCATYNTYGEVDNFSMIGSLMVHPEYRGHGYATEIALHICKVLHEERKQVACLIKYDNLSSWNLHTRIGVRPVTDIYKYVRRK